MKEPQKGETQYLSKNCSNPLLTAELDMHAGETLDGLAEASMLESSIA